MRVERFILANGRMEGYNSLDISHTYQHPDGITYVLASDYDALAARYRHVLSVMRRDGYWSAVMPDAEVDAQVDEDIARAAVADGEQHG